MANSIWPLAMLLMSVIPPPLSGGMLTELFFWRSYTVGVGTPEAET